MNCPVCGIKCIAVFHEWKGSENRAYFEYYHAEEDGGVRREPCSINIPYNEGLLRYEDEWNAMMENGDASEVS
jgi:hypothetical protein